MIPACGTDTGGHDGDDGRALRYLEWSHPIRHGDSTHTVDYVIVTHEASGESQAVPDRHIEGLFARRMWLNLLRSAGFEVDVGVRDEGRDIFVGVKHG
jgi:hypothetical protein